MTRYAQPIVLEPVPALIAANAEQLCQRLVEQTENLVALSGHLDTELLFVSPEQAFRHGLRGEKDHLSQEVLAAALLSPLDPLPPLRARRGEWTEGGVREATLLILQAGGDWLLARRPFVRSDDGVGTWLGAWSLRRGGAGSHLPAPLRSWLEADDVPAVNFIFGKTAANYDIRMGIVPLAAPMARDALGMATVLGALVDEEMAEDGLPPFLVFVQRPDALERWEVRGDPGCDPHDLIRGIANQDEVSAVVLVHPAVVEGPHGHRSRAIALRAEMEGQIVQRVMPYQNTDAGLLLGEPWLGAPRYVRPGEGWIGQDPRSPLPDLTEPALGPYAHAMPMA